MKLNIGIKLMCLQALVISGAFATHALAKEVFTWTDENGVVHYSDVPSDDRPSAEIDVPEVYRPGTAELAQPAELSNNEGDTEALSAAQQRRARITENSAIRKEQRAEIERMCTQHQQRLTQMEPARRIYYTDESGENVRMDDDQRMGLIAESRDYIDKNCR